MSERIKYQPTEQGIDITIPKRLGSKLTTSDGRTIPRFLRLYDLPEESRMFELEPGADEYYLRMHFERLATARSPERFANFIRQLSAVHHEVIESATVDERNESARICYSDEVMLGGVYGMAALLHWPEGSFDERVLEGEVRTAMSSAAFHLLKIPTPWSPNIMHVRLRKHLQPKMIIGTDAPAGLIGSNDYDPTSEFFSMHGGSMTTDAEQLVSIAGLAAFAHFHESTPGQSQETTL